MPSRRGSSGFRVSLAGPSSAVDYRGWRRHEIPKRRRTPRASARVVGSATVGPEPMVAGSSPATSEMARVTRVRRRRGGGEPAALDRREMLAHRIDLADVGARCKQGAGHGLLVSQSQTRRRQAEQGRRPAGQQKQHQVVRPGRAAPCSRMCRGRLGAGPVGHRMRRLEDADRPARHRMAVARDDQPFDRAQSGQVSSTVRAMAAAALPAPSTTVRPFGCASASATSSASAAGRQRSGSGQRQRLRRASGAARAGGSKACPEPVEGGGASLISRTGRRKPV